MWVPNGTGADMPVGERVLEAPPPHRDAVGAHVGSDLSSMGEIWGETVMIGMAMLTMSVNAMAAVGTRRRPYQDMAVREILHWAIDGTIM